MDRKDNLNGVVALFGGLLFVLIALFLMWIYPNVMSESSSTGVDNISVAYSAYHSE